MPGGGAHGPMVFDGTPFDENNQLGLAVPELGAAAAEPLGDIELGRRDEAEKDKKEEAGLDAHGREAEEYSRIDDGEDQAPAEPKAKLKALCEFEVERTFDHFARNQEFSKRLMDMYSQRFTGTRAVSTEWFVQQAQWLTALFPDLPAASGAAKRTTSTWPAEARALAHSLLRTDKLAKLQGGIEIGQTAESFDVRGGDLSSRSRLLALLSAGAWLTRGEGDGQATLIQWCDGRERGVFSRPFRLGRIRAATPLDPQTRPLDLSDCSLSPLDAAYGHYTASVEPQKEGRALLVLKHSSGYTSETRVLIDTTRHVILHLENRLNGKKTGITRFDDFVEVAGCWWARKVETSDDQGRVSYRVTRTIQSSTAEAVAKQMNSELAEKDEVQFLRLPMKTLVQAKKAVAEDKASFDDHFTLLLHFAARQQWTRAAEHLQKCETLATGKPGMRWLRSSFMQVSRRHEELRKRLLEEAGHLTKAKPKNPAGSDDLVLAEHVLSQGVQILQANEMLALLDQLQPIYARQPAHRHSMKRWAQQHLRAVQQTGQTDEALRLQKQLAVAWPRDASLQQQYAQALANTGTYPAAYAWLKTVLDKKRAGCLTRKNRCAACMSNFLKGKAAIRNWSIISPIGSRGTPKVPRPMRNTSAP